MAERARLSPYNAECRPRIEHTARLNDCTLREGEQSAEAAFTFQDRCRVAAALAEAGVHRIQLGFARGEADRVREVVRAAAPAETEALVVAFAPDWRRQIDEALVAGVSHLNIIYRASPPLLRLLGSSPEQLVETSVAAVSYAKSQGARVIFSPTDTTRAEWSTLEQVYRETVRAGADGVYVLDTVGVATPQAIAFLVGAVRKVCGVPVGIHVHNDFGLALANALAGYEAGAEYIDVCVNGLGDRCGNPALDEVAVALELLYGRSSGVRLDRMSAIAALVAELSGLPIPANKPITGVNAFAQKLDIHVRALLADPLAFQPFLPELVGNRPRLVMGKNTGPYALRAKLAELGETAPLSDEQACRAVQLVEQLAEQKKRAVEDAELLEIVAQVRSSSSN